MAIEFTSMGYDNIDKIIDDFIREIKSVEKAGNAEEYFEELLIIISDYIDYLKIMGYAV